MSTKYRYIGIVQAILQQKSGKNDFLPECFTFIMIEGIAYFKKSFAKASKAGKEFSIVFRLTQYEILK